KGRPIDHENDITSDVDGCQTRRLAPLKKHKNRTQPLNFFYKCLNDTGLGGPCHEKERFKRKTGFRLLLASCYRLPEDSDRRAAVFAANGAGELVPAAAHPG